MTGQARLYQLMAQKEGIALGRVQAEMRALLMARDEARRSAERLSAVMAEPAAGPTSVAALRSERQLKEQIAAEILRLTGRMEEMDRQIAALQSDLAAQDHRHRVMEEAGQTARRAEAEARQSARDAAFAHGRRPGG